MLNRFKYAGVILFFTVFAITVKTTFGKAGGSNRASFNDLFRTNETISIKGDSLTPINRIIPFVSRKRIFVCDITNSKILVFDKKGNLITKIGNKGQGPSEFRIPHGVAIDKHNQLYVNDRGNSRIQIFSPTYELINTIYIPGQNESIFLKKNSENRIVIIGIRNCPEHKVCLIGEHSLNGTYLKGYDKVNRNQKYIMSSWIAAQDEEGNIFIINRLDNDLTIYDKFGEKLRNIQLNSPSIISLNKKYQNEPETRTELGKLLRALRTEIYTEFYTIIARKGLIYVSLRVNKKNTYLLDIYDYDGKVVYYGINSFRLINNVDDNFYFADIDDSSEFGSIVINGAFSTINR